MLQHAASANLYILMIILGVLLMASGWRDKPIPFLDADYRVLGLIAFVVGVCMILGRLGI